LNTYGYVGGNPVKYSDSKGLAPMDPSEINLDDGSGWPNNIPNSQLNEYFNPEIEQYGEGKLKCMAKCYAKRQLMCTPWSVGGAGLGTTVAAVGSVWTGGSSFAVTNRPAAFIGSQVGSNICKAISYDQSCSDECDEKMSCNNE